MADVAYRELIEYPGYRIGSDGSVWSKHRKGPNPSQTFRKNWTQLKPGKSAGGYLAVALRNWCGEFEFKPVHILVLEAFIGPRPKGMIGRHFPDHDVTNNHVTNLRWGTYQQNADDRERAGNTARGERNRNSKLTEADVHEIRAASGRGCVAAMCRKFGVSRQVVWKIRRRDTWTHI